MGASPGTIETGKSGIFAIIIWIHCKLSQHIDFVIRPLYEYSIILVPFMVPSLTNSLALYSKARSYYRAI
jgi:hypothetical protein